MKSQTEEDIYSFLLRLTAVQDLLLRKLLNHAAGGDGPVALKRLYGGERPARAARALVFGWRDNSRVAARGQSE